MSRKHCFTRVRNRGSFRLNKDTQMVRLFGLEQEDGQDWTEWTYRSVSLRVAEQMVAAGEAEVVCDVIVDELTVVGYRRTQAATGAPSPTTLTRSTMDAVANGKHGGLSFAERRQVEKYQVWALIGDTRAVAVRPRISDAERRRGLRLLGVKVAA